MSAGHRHKGMGMGSHVIEKLLSDKEVVQRLYASHEINRDYDIPYLGGYSVDGKIIYFDRHLPDKISFDVDGKEYTYFPDIYLKQHEAFEKAVMGALGWSYSAAHEAATGYERRAVIAGGLPWDGYQKSLKPYIKADQHEKLEKLPKDLDLQPYYEQPVDHALVARIKAAMGGGKEAGKQNKADVKYSEGMPSSHCGPVDKWPKGRCKHFEVPHSCCLVKGYIKPNYWCELWEKSDLG